MNKQKITMNTKTISIPEDAFVDILKSLPENILTNIFWKTFVHTDDSPLSESDKKEISKAKDEFRKGETIRWQHIK